MILDVGASTWNIVCKDSPTYRAIISYRVPQDIPYVGPDWRHSENGEIWPSINWSRTRPTNPLRRDRIR